jgi:uncharacterized protein DUF932
MNFTQELSNERILQLAPSAFAVQPYAKQSSRYSFIPTSDVIAGMRDSGYVPVQATQSRTRIADKKDFTKHMIRFRAIQDLTRTATVGDSVLEAVLVNSHDGSSTYEFMGGVYRWTCANGAMVSDGLFASLKIRHTGNVIQEVIESTKRLFEAAPKVIDVIGKWGKIQLRDEEQLALASAAHTVRFSDEPTNITPEHLLTARRYDDRGTDLWRTFNRIQENTTKGIKLRGTRGSRAVKSINGDVNLNKALWTLAEKMAELKA